MPSCHFPFNLGHSSINDTCFNCQLSTGFLISEVDTCVSQPCMNGGTCVNTKESYRCDCAPGYNGVNCEKELNECLSSPCYQSSTCVNKVFHSYTDIPVYFSDWQMTILIRCVQYNIGHHRLQMTLILTQTMSCTQACFVHAFTLGHYDCIHENQIYPFVKFSTLWTLFPYGKKDTFTNSDGLVWTSNVNRLSVKRA